MTEIELKLTNNPWINNGIIRFYIELKKKNTSINLTSKSITITSNKIEKCIDNIIYELAYNGTHNLSGDLKFLKLNSSNVYQYKRPQSKKDLNKKRKICVEDKQLLKESEINIYSEKIWKQRLNYLGKSNEYVKYGLNFSKENIYKVLKDNKRSNKICPICGNFSRLVDNKQFFNPLSNEHHNNKDEGYGGKRYTLKICPFCASMGFISLFDKYIPFLNLNNKTMIALPLSDNFEILEKILNNLSIPSQCINFDDVNISNYNTNIKNLNNKCISSAILSLMDNIQNNYSKKEHDSLFEDLTDNELMQICDWLLLNKDSMLYQHIHANNKIYEILKPVEEKGSNKYLLKDCLNNINIKGYNIVKLENLYNSILLLDKIRIYENLFNLSKYNIAKIEDKKNGYSFYLFLNIFLDKIMEDSIMLDNNMKESVKKISKMIGRSFYDNIGMMSKFAYATNIKVLKDSIEESFFLMAKKAALDKETSFSFKMEDLEFLLDNLNEDEFEDIKSYFVSFMSASAIRMNYYITNKRRKESK